MSTYSLGTIATGLALVIGPDPVSLTRGELEPAPLACTATGSLEEGFELELDFMGIKLGISIRWSRVTGTYTATNTTNENKEGCLTFTDSNGDPVGDPQNVSIPAGGSITGPLPDGATGFEISDEPCDDPEPEPEPTKLGSRNQALGATQRGGVQQQVQVVGIRPKPKKTMYTYYGGPVVVDPFEDSRQYAITVFTSKKSAAEKIRDHIRDFGFSVPLPNLPSVSDIEVHHFLETHVDYGGMVIRFTFANDDAFASLAVDVNGVANVLTLPQATTVTTANGWDAVQLALPFDDRSVNYDPTPGAQWQNAWSASFTTDEPLEIGPTVAGGDVTFVSE